MPWQRSYKAISGRYALLCEIITYTMYSMWDMWDLQFKLKLHIIYLRTKVIE